MLETSSATAGDISGTELNVGARPEADRCCCAAALPASGAGSDRRPLELSFVSRAAKPRYFQADRGPCRLLRWSRWDWHHPSLQAPALEQETRYSHVSDGVRLAYAKVGTGPPLAPTAHRPAHLEHDLNHLFPSLAVGLARDSTLTCYDARGTLIRLGRLLNFVGMPGSADLKWWSMRSWGRRFPLSRNVARMRGRASCSRCGYPQRCPHPLGWRVCGSRSSQVTERDDADRERTAAMVTLDEMKVGRGESDL